MIYLESRVMVNNPYELVFQKVPRVLERNGIEITRMDFDKKEIGGRIFPGSSQSEAEFDIRFWDGEDCTLVEASVKKPATSQGQETMEELMESLVNDMEKIGKN